MNLAVQAPHPHGGGERELRTARMETSPVIEDMENTQANDNLFSVTAFCCSETGSYCAAFGFPSAGIKGSVPCLAL